MNKGEPALAYSCLYRETDNNFEVIFQGKLYNLQTSDIPQLFVDTIFTDSSYGNYMTSSEDKCSLFIALSPLQDEFSRGYQNYDVGLCVYQQR